MPIGSRKKRGSDEYVFIDGVAMRADEAVRIELTDADTSAVPGQAEAVNVPGAKEAGAVKKKPKWSLSKAYKDLDSGSAFELNEDFALSMQHTMSLMKDDKRKTARAIGLLLLAFLVIFCFSLCIGGGDAPAGTLYSPITVVRAIVRWIYLSIGKLFHLSYYTALSPFEAAQEIPGYGFIMARAGTTIGTIICGLLLALAGMMYQNVFKNPLASPTMLGVSAGVRIGTIILVLIFGELALQMETTRYVFCYVGGIIILLLVLGFSKLMAGGGKINVADMLIAGSIFAQLLGSVSQFFLSYVMDDDQYEVFYELTSGMRDQYEWFAFVLLILVVIIAVVPVFLARFRLNTIAFDDSEARLLGVNPQTTRVFVLVAGTIMILAAQIHVGVISLVSLVVPFIVRYIVGSEFGKQLIGNLIFGPLILLVCRAICGLIPFAGASLSLQMVVGLVGLPLYIWMTALGQKGWE